MNLPIDFNPSESLHAQRSRAALVVAALMLVVGQANFEAGDARGESPLITRGDAARLGLERAWYAQTPVDPARSRVTNWHLDYDRLYSLTDSGLLTALDAETGTQLWTKSIGKPGVAALGPAANDQYVAVISGSRLYLLDRDTGRLKWSHSLGSAPSAGPALSRRYAYVALLTGRIEGYKLDDPDLQPWYYQSKGRTHLRPTTTGDIVSWPTSTGNLYVSRADAPQVLFRLESNGDIVTSPAEKAPYLYIASLDGNLYSLNENTGREQWRYGTGYAIESSPAIVGDHAYVASLEPVLHAIDAATGLPLWKAPGVSHFAAQGQERVYASDRFGNLVVLDLKTGERLGGLRTAQGTRTLVNDQTDRLFLVDDRGLVQSFHEMGVAEPTWYRQAPSAAPPAAPGVAAEAAATEAAPAEVEPAPAASESPFGAPADEAPEGDEDDNPFDS